MEHDSSYSAFGLIQEVRDLEANLSRTQEQLNLLCNWITHKFRGDETLPKGLRTKLKRKKTQLFSQSEYGGNRSVHSGITENGDEVEILELLADPLAANQSIKPEEITEFSESTNYEEEGLKIIDVQSLIGHNKGASPGEHHSFHCAICEETFKSKAQLRQHVRGYHHPNSFESKKILPASIQKPTEESEDEFEEGSVESDVDYIPNTNIPTKKKTTLRSYEQATSRPRVPGSKKEQKCEFCNKDFLSRVGLYLHLKRFHPMEYEAQTASVQTSCPDCGKRCIGRRGIICHQLMVHPEKFQRKREAIQDLYHCPDCDKTFFIQQSRRNHMLKFHPNSPIPPSSLKVPKSSVKVKA